MKRRQWISQSSPTQDLADTRTVPPVQEVLRSSCLLQHFIVIVALHHARTVPQRRVRTNLCRKATSGEGALAQSRRFARSRRMRAITSRCTGSGALPTICQRPADIQFRLAIASLISRSVAARTTRSSFAGAQKSGTRAEEEKCSCKRGLFSQLSLDGLVNLRDIVRGKTAPTATTPFLHGIWRAATLHLRQRLVGEAQDAMRGCGARAGEPNSAGPLVIQQSLHQKCTIRDLAVSFSASSSNSCFFLARQVFIPSSIVPAFVSSLHFFIIADFSRSSSQVA